MSEFQLRSKNYEVERVRTKMQAKLERTSSDCERREFSSKRVKSDRTLKHWKIEVEPLSTPA
jgi:hypothetical protein